MVHGSFTIKLHFNTFRPSFKMTKILVCNIFYHFLLAVSLGNKASKMSEKCRLDRNIGFQNMFYINCINVIIDSIGPLFILRSICTCGCQSISYLQDICEPVLLDKIFYLSLHTWLERYCLMSENNPGQS